MIEYAIAMKSIWIALALIGVLTLGLVAIANSTEAPPKSDTEYPQPGSGRR